MWVLCAVAGMHSRFFSSPKTECIHGHSVDWTVQQLFGWKPDEINQMHGISLQQLTCNLLNRSDSVSSCASSFFRHLSFKSVFIMRWTDERDILVSCAICLMLRWVCGWSSWLCTKSVTLSMLSSVWTVQLVRPVPGRHLIVPNLSIFTNRWSNPCRLQFLFGNSLKIDEHYTVFLHAIL